MPDKAPSATVSRLRAQVARRTQSYPEDHSKVVEVRQALAYEVLREHAERVVADWPAPTSEQRATLSALLQTSGGA